jgi:hypothetical protein
LKDIPTLTSIAHRPGHRPRADANEGLILSQGSQFNSRRFADLPPFVTQHDAVNLSRRRPANQLISEVT